MHHLPFLAQVHDLLQPRTYVEIGGRDDFASIEPPSPDQAPVDLALITRPGRYEPALRGMIDVERHAGPGSVVIMDDVLPRPGVPTSSSTSGAAPTDEPDVWKIVPTLREIRPDLILLLVRTVPTGMLLVLGADPTDRRLDAARDDLLARHRGSGEPAPPEIVTRASAVYPAWIIGAPFWDVLRAQRALGVPAAQGRADLIAALQEWASTTLNDRQARAIHPSLTGRPAPARKPSGPGPGSGIERGLRILVRASKQVVARTDR